ncbi:alpha-hemolysin [Glaciecola sp. KUL10]|nr:alpha-hemolysin [Glaciecola sp. KUL10]
MQAGKLNTQKLKRLSTLPFRMLIKAYQTFLSPLLGQNCRFHPSCSCYAKEALEVHGLTKGLLLSTKRIIKCNPMHPGGFDYVPKPNTLAVEKNADRKIKHQQ